MAAKAADLADDADDTQWTKEDFRCGFGLSCAVKSPTTYRWSHHANSLLQIAILGGFAAFFRFTPGVSAQIGGAVSRDGGGCTPGRIEPSVEAIEGSPGPDMLIGSSAGDSLLGKSGNDQLFGRAGNDTLSGGPGNDRLVGGPGHDSEHQ